MWNSDARKLREIKGNFFLKNMTSLLTAGFVHLCPVSQFRLETWPKTGRRWVWEASHQLSNYRPVTYRAKFKLVITAAPSPLCLCSELVLKQPGEMCIGRDIPSPLSSVWEKGPMKTVVLSECHLLEERDCCGSDLAQNQDHVWSMASSQ